MDSKRLILYNSAKTYLENPHYETFRKLSHVVVGDRTKCALNIIPSLRNCHMCVLNDTEVLHMIDACSVMYTMCGHSSLSTKHRHFVYDQNEARLIIIITKLLAWLEVAE